MNSLSSVSDVIERYINIPEIALEKLNEKYKIEFEVSSIGDRWNKNTATLICHPSDDEDLKFKAVIDFVSCQLEDNYILRKNEFEFDKILAGKFDSKGFACSSKTLFAGKHVDSVCGSLDEYVNNPEIIDLFITVFANADNIKSGCDVNRWLDVVKNLNLQYCDKGIVVAAYFIPEKNYYEYSADLKKKTVINPAWLDTLEYDYQLNIVIRSGQVTMDKNVDEIFTSKKGGDLQCLIM